VPTITWAAPAPIPYGTALSSTQLDATANVPGTFSYSPSAETVLSIGAHTLSVTFTPTDTTNYTTATATVTLAVQDFSLSSAPPSVTLSAGHTATTTFPVSPVSGLTGTVSFTCAVPAAMTEASCSATSVVLDGASSATSTLTVNTTAAHQANLGPMRFRWLSSGGGVIFAGFVLLGTPVSRRRRWRSLALLAVLVVLVAAIGCGGGAATSGGTGTGGGTSNTDPGTPAGSYSLTVTATSGSLSHTMAVAVTVR
jgi:trimeric autotransporter adhesin